MSRTVTEKIKTLMEMKSRGEKITMLTCYDYPTAKIMDAAGLDIIFTGDSVGTNILGYESPRQVSMADMLHHFSAVRRGVSHSITMVDMPFGSFENSEIALANARKFIKIGADIVKIEGGEEKAQVVRVLSEDGINICAHIGFTPQTADHSKIVIGAKSEEAEKLFYDALALQDAGAKLLVLECVPERVAKIISENITIPTIGIGSGRYCDGQVLVVTDMLGINQLNLRFLKSYADLGKITAEAFQSYIAEVKSGNFPAESHFFRLKSEELQIFKDKISKGRSELKL